MPESKQQFETGIVKNDSSQFLTKE